MLGSFLISSIFLLHHSQGQFIRVGGLFHRQLPYTKKENDIPDGNVGISGLDYSRLTGDDAAMLNVPEDKKRKEFDDRINYLRNINMDFRYRLSFEFFISRINQRRMLDYNLTKPITTSSLVYEYGPCSTFKLAKQVCRQLEQGVAAIFSTSDSTFLASTAAYKRMPVYYITTDAKKNQRLINNQRSRTRGEKSYSFYLTPGIEMWSRAISDVITSFRWKKLIILYCFDAKRVQNIPDYLYRGANMDVLTIKVPNNAQDGSWQLDGVLGAVRQRSVFRVLLDCPTDASFIETFAAAASRLDMMGQDYHYLFYGMDAHLSLAKRRYSLDANRFTCFGLFGPADDMQRADWREFVASGLTQTYKMKAFDEMTMDPALLQMTSSVALTHDALLSFVTSLVNFKNDREQNFYHRSLPCVDDNHWLAGDGMRRSILASNFTGLTGPVSFDENGQRNNVTIKIFSTNPQQGLTEVGQWRSMGDMNVYDPRRLNIYSNSFYNAEQGWRKSLKDEKLRISIILERPYAFKIMEEGKKKYDGYCIDLIKLLAKNLGFKYELIEVPDKQYGEPKANGTWDGLMGEVISRRVDAAVAPLTITYGREKVVRFTKPFMSLGVSILYRKPLLKEPSLLAFLDPLSPTIWLLVLIALLMVGFLMFFIVRYSPYERTEDSEVEEVNNGILTGLWFGIGALMQQGSELSPRSVSGRILASIWWFFTLVLISSYTANLAAFLTVNQMEDTITSVEGLAAQTKVQYGTMREGSTADFFKLSKIDTYIKMWDVMSSNPQFFSESNEKGMERVLQGDYAYMMESTTLQYIVKHDCNLTQVGGLLDSRGYGIATMDNGLRDNLTLAILDLLEHGNLEKLKEKWWNRGAKVCSPNTESKNSALTFYNLGGAFILLATGGVVAMAAVIIELAYFSRKKLKKEGQETIQVAATSVPTSGCKIDCSPTSTNNNNIFPPRHHQCCSCFISNIRSSLCRSTLNMSTPSATDSMKVDWEHNSATLPSNHETTFGVMEAAVTKDTTVKYLENEKQQQQQQQQQQQHSNEAISNQLHHSNKQIDNYTASNFASTFDRKLLASASHSRSSTYGSSSTIPIRSTPRVVIGDSVQPPAVTLACYVAKHQRHVDARRNIDPYPRVYIENNPSKTQLRKIPVKGESAIRQQQQQQQQQQKQKDNSPVRLNR